MQFSITGKHVYYLRKHGQLELEAILPPSKLEALRDALSKALRLRLGDNWKLERASTQFVEGHDLHCENEEIQKIISQRAWAAAFSELLDTRPLRLGFDQFFPANRGTEGKQDHPYRDFLERNLSLKEAACIDGIAGGLLLCLEAPTEETTLPSTPGDAILFMPEQPLPLSALNSVNAGSYFLITYAEPVALYISNKNDPHIHTLKRWGYGYGDKLKEPQYPIIYR